MTGPVAEALIAVLAATASLSVFAVVGRRTLAAIPAAGAASDAGRP
jgi:hypothetical protein